MAWCFSDEQTAQTRALIVDVANNGAVVPGLWHWETANVLAQAVRRGRIKAADAATLQSMLAALPIATDALSTQRAWAETFQLAAMHNLSVYDAAYLDLAILRALPLATTDKALMQAAKSAGVALVL